MFPAPGSDQSPDEFLPHIAFSRRTLPWEREGPDSAPTTPWLALLLFKESELKSAEQRKQAPAVSVTQLTVQNIPDLTTRTRLMNTLHIPGETEVSTLAVANSLLRQIMPTTAELPLLCHMKRETVNGADVDHAIVVCNRLPDASAPAGQKPEVHTAVLVSVEKAPGLFALPATGTTTLLVLHHWTFRPSQGGDFEQVIKSIAYRPHGGVLRFGNLPAPVAAGENAPLSGGFKGLLDKDGYFLTPRRARSGGQRDLSQPAPSVHAAAAQLRVRDRARHPNEFETADQSTPLDFAHAAAFELDGCSP